MTMKKKLAALLALSLIFAQAAPALCPAVGQFSLTAKAYDIDETIEYEGFRFYKNYQGELTLSGYSGDETELVIPEKVEDIPVTAIGCSAFEGVKGITSVKLPDTIRNIENNAFSRMADLTSINIPQAVVLVLYDSFSECYKLENIDIQCDPQAITRNTFIDTKWFSDKVENGEMIIVGNAIIDGTAASGDLVIDDSIEIIQDEAFSGNMDITSVKIPESVKSVGFGAFSSSGLESAVFEGDPEFMHSDIFNSCASLKSVTLPDNIEFLPESTFWGCSALEDIVLPDSLRKIGYIAFGSCRSLPADFALNDGLTEIGGCAFYDCPQFDEVVLPDSVKIIGEEAFSQCGDIVVTIPSSVEEIGTDAIDSYEDTDSVTAVLCYSNSAAEKFAILNKVRYDLLKGADPSLGDINGDGSVNVADITLLAAHVKGVRAVEKAADVNYDGKLNITDCTVIAAHVKGVKPLSGRTRDIPDSDTVTSPTLAYTETDRQFTSNITWDEVEGADYYIIDDGSWDTYITETNTCDLGKGVCCLNITVDPIRLVRDKASGYIITSSLPGYKFTAFLDPEERSLHTGGVRTKDGVADVIIGSNRSAMYEIVLDGKQLERSYLSDVYSFDIEDGSHKLEITPILEYHLSDETVERRMTPEVYNINSGSGTTFDMYYVHGDERGLERLSKAELEPCRSYRSDGETVYLTDSDIKILSDFAEKHFTPDMTPAEKVDYTRQWLHGFMTYSFDVTNDTAKDAFVIGQGNCWQYNGGLAMMMAYLGYDVDLIYGHYRENTHRWAQVNIGDDTYMMEVGNVGQYNSGWGHLADDLDADDGYIWP